MAEEQMDTRTDATTGLDFKCSRCGSMFPVEGDVKANCPFCGYDCSDGTCQALTGGKMPHQAE